MSQNKLVINTADFIRDLRALPDELKGEATGIVMDAATRTKDTVGAVYAEHRVTGNLARGITLHVNEIGTFGTQAEVRSRAPHAWLFEKGSRARHYFTKGGGKHETGEMWGKAPNPPTHIFIRTAINMRRTMHEKLIALVRRKGLTVTGTIE